MRRKGKNTLYSLDGMNNGAEGRRMVYEDTNGMPEKPQRKGFHCQLIKAYKTQRQPPPSSLLFSR